MLKKGEEGGIVPKRKPEGWIKVPNWEGQARFVGF